MKDIYIVFNSHNGVEKIDSIWDDPDDVKIYLQDLGSKDKKIVRSFIMNESEKKQNYTEYDDTNSIPYKPWEQEIWKQIVESLSFLHKEGKNPSLKWYDEGITVALTLLEKALKCDYQQRNKDGLL